MRGVVFALPGLAQVLGAPLFTGPGDHGLPAGTVPLPAGALCGRTWNQGLAHRQTDVRLCHFVYDVPRRRRPGGSGRARGAAVYCAVPGTGDHPWGTLPYPLHKPEITS
ncbi:hypothetical protein ACFWAZ_18280 [Streptomyces collinus]|uniref:hypothetical protein n=1 Tax=Streptomyces collinus TaxID=42684 RepID=UPI0036603DFC